MHDNPDETPGRPLGPDTAGPVAESSPVLEAIELLNEVEQVDELLERLRQRPDFLARARTWLDRPSPWD